MKKKVQIILLLFSISMCACLMSNTYSRYVADTTGNIDVLLAKWQILVNETDITGNEALAIDISPVIEENKNVKKDLIVPTSKGYFDIDIDPSNVELSFNYSISLEIDNSEIPDLIIAKYSIITDKEADNFELFELNDTVITDTLLYDNTTSDFAFEPFTVRVYFEWYDGEDKEMTDEEQSEASKSSSTFSINANISFAQEV